MGMNIGMKTMQRSAGSAAPTVTIRRLPASGNTALAASALIQAALGIEFFLSGLNKFADPNFVRNFQLFVDASPGTHTGVLASYRFFFDRHNGVELNYGYALNTQTYRLAGAPLGVKSNSHEASAAYVFRFPLRHWTPFALTGVGGLVFDPTEAPGASTQARAGFQPIPNRR